MSPRFNSQTRLQMQARHANANQFTSGDMFSQTVCMYTIASKINHSCSPNAMCLTPLDKSATHHTVKALRDIAE